MKHEEAKSSIKLIIAIAAIIIVVIIGVNYAMNFFKKENAKNLQADLLLIKAKVEIIKGNYSVNKEENPLRGILLTQLPEDINISEFKEKNVISQEEYEKYYLLDSTSLEQMELQELVNKYSGYFLVNYENFEVIYTEGYENENGLWCYKISDLTKAPEQPKPISIPNNNLVDNNENEGENSQTQLEENTETVEENNEQSEQNNN